MVSVVHENRLLGDMEKDTGLGKYKIKLSTDADNSLTRGTDGGLYVAATSTPPPANTAPNISALSVNKPASIEAAGSGTVSFSGAFDAEDGANVTYSISGLTGATASKTSGIAQNESVTLTATGAASTNITFQVIATDTEALSSAASPMQTIGIVTPAPPSWVFFNLPASNFMAAYTGWQGTHTEVSSAMNDGISNTNSSIMAVSAASGSGIVMDFGQPRNVAQVKLMRPLGTVYSFDAAGGLNGRELIASNDGVAWTVINASMPTFANNELKTLNVNGTYRYIGVRSNAGNQVAIAEFVPVFA